MTDDDVLPLDGAFPDDPELTARVAQAYVNTPPADERMVARCVRLVLERAAAANAPATPARWRWIAGATAAIAAAVVASVVLRSPEPDADTSGALTAAAPVGATTNVEGGVQFQLRLPNDSAAKVSVVGDFNGWDASATPMVKGRADGEWSAKIALLPGRHVYAFVVNGEQWVVDPLAPQIPDAGYGPANALVVEGGTR